MKRTVFKQGLLIGVTVLGLASTVSMVAQAIPARAEEAQASAQERQATAQTNAEERKAAAQTRLAGDKLKVCQTREKAITNIMIRLSDRGQKQLNLFNMTAERTEKFYTNKGKVLANYNTLVADVAAKKAAAQATINAVKSTVPEFRCDGTDPKGVAAAFKDKLKDEIEALKAYKTAVKNLIVGVKSVQGTTSSDNKGTN